MSFFYSLISIPSQVLTHVLAVIKERAPDTLALCSAVMNAWNVIWTAPPTQPALALPLEVDANMVRRALSGDQTVALIDMVRSRQAIQPGGAGLTEGATQQARHETLLFETVGTCIKNRTSAPTKKEHSF